MIPDTKGGLPSMACVSAMQKAIRRSMEREAMEFAVDLMHTSKAFHSMVCNRLEIICHEDLDTLAAPRGIRDRTRLPVIVRKPSMMCGPADRAKEQAATLGTWEKDR
jgi:hypothetical protein